MSNPLDKTSPVRLEAASFLLDRAAHVQFAQFMDALRAEYDAAVQNLLNSGSNTVQIAQGAALALHDLVRRIETAETTLNQYQSRKSSQQKEMN